MKHMHMKNKLTTQELMVLSSEMEARKKSPVVAYLLCISLGVFGAHRFYLDKTGSAIAMLLLTVLTFGVGIIVTGIWMLVDLFLINGMIEEANDKLEEQIIFEINMMRDIDRQKGE